MKFIVSSLSPGMVEYGDFMLSFHEVSDTEFQALCFDAFSCVGHQDIADCINVAYNKQTVHARPGDVLLYANKEKGVMKFYCIQILRPLDVLQREYGEV